MRTYLLILYLLLAHCLAHAQKIRFTDTSNKWHYVNKYLFNNFWSPVKSSIIGTTVQNGISYGIYTSIHDSALVRFDSITNRVYTKIYRNHYYGADTAEFVLYDFGLNIGDSLKTPQFDYVVIGKDSLNINGTKHYTFELQTHNISTINIIEGIGSIQDPLMPYIGFFFEEQQRLTCFQQHGGFPVLSSGYDGFDNNISCKDTNGVDVKAIPTHNKDIIVSPNPANQYSKITFPYTIQSGQLTITDILGKTISTKTISNKTEIVIGEMPTNGMYFYVITDNSGNKFAGRFVYQ